MKKLIKLFVVMVLCAFTVVAGMPNIEVNAESSLDHLIINQIYGSGGKDETPVSHDFIEIYNPTTQDVSLNGYSIKYDAGNSLTLNNVTLNKNTSYLIRCNASQSTSNPTLSISVYDQEWNQTIDNKKYEISLMNNENVIDSIKVIDNGSLKISKQKAIRRLNFVDTDTDADFEIFEYNAATSENVALKKPRSIADGTWGTNSTPEITPTPEPEPIPDSSKLNTTSEKGILKYLGSYSTGVTNADGGVAEIVKYNADNQCMYLVSGQFQSIDVVSLAKIDATLGTANSYSLLKRIDIASLASANGFVSTDITSVDVNTENDLIAIAVQGGDNANGSIVLLDYDGKYLTHFTAGVQPDMVTFTSDGKYVLSANEGEPRDGYGEGKTDPQGSVSVVALNYDDLKNSVVRKADFTAFDAQREKLVNQKVLLKKNTMPSVDLEPEYIAVANDNKTAYVSLQENNAIAILDIEDAVFKDVKGLGLKDHSLVGNELDLNKDGNISIQNENVLGVYMPDGLATAQINGVTYVLTPNEGDAREWGDYTDILEKKINNSAKKVELLNPEEFDGLDASKDYTFGARSFSIWNAETMEQVYDSGSDFETITARLFPTLFNSNHKELEADGRSSKKGPEPEDVKVLDTGYATYAFVGLERTGGVMMYDISSPSNSTYVDYLNVRDTLNGDLDNGSDLGAEGLSVVSADKSPTGKPLLLTANEVSGTVTVIEIQVESKPVVTTPETLNPDNNGGVTNTEPNTETNSDKGVNTGDNTDPMLYLMLLVIGVAGGLYTYKNAMHS